MRLAWPGRLKLKEIGLARASQAACSVSVHLSLVIIHRPKGRLKGNAATSGHVAVELSGQPRVVSETGSWQVMVRAVASLLIAVLLALTTSASSQAQKKPGPPPRAAPAPHPAAPPRPAPPHVAAPPRPAPHIAAPPPRSEER